MPELRQKPVSVESTVVWAPNTKTRCRGTRMRVSNGVNRAIARFPNGTLIISRHLQVPVNRLSGHSESLGNASLKVDTEGI
jgi:hypothetical protein